MKSEVTREDVIRHFPLESHLRELGIKLLGTGRQRKATRCAVKEHRKDHWCVTVDVEEQWWNCHDCKRGGTIVDWIAIEQNRSDTDVFKELCDERSKSAPQTEQRAESRKPSGPKRRVCHYDYQDESGEPLFRVIRFEPKTFEQHRYTGNGNYVPGMSGITRVLYRLPSVIAAETVICVEGEKDADNLAELGFVATTSCGGAKGWLPAYADFLTGKHVVIIPDRDAPGKEYSDSIIKSCESKVLSIKVVQVPDPHKDISDYIESFEFPFEAYEPIQKLIERSAHALKPLPVYSIREMEQRYIDSLNVDESRSFDLGRFAPSLGGAVRKLLPGELICLMGGTGVGKTAIMQTMAKAAAPLPTLFFEMELPPELMFERFAQIDTARTGASIEEDYKSDPTPRWLELQSLGHIYVCPESGITVDQIEDYIRRSQLKIGVEPAVVFVDYIGLVRSEKGRSRYETVSNAAEQLKVIAKRTRTIVIMGTQVSRPYKGPDPKDGSEENGDIKGVKLHDAKDSGSIENSAGLVLGAWRTDARTLKIRVLKNTKGISGREVTMNFDGATMHLQERPRISEEDAAQMAAQPLGSVPPEYEAQQEMEYQHASD